MTTETPVRDAVGQQPRTDLPLAVDMDGTLLKTDSLHEGLVRLVLRDWASLFRLPGWLLRGRAYFKRQIATRAAPDPKLLCYNERLVAYLSDQRRRGRKLVLATAADRSIAESVARHIGLFDEVLASDGTRNLRGKTKADALVQRFGQGKFAYAGNDSTDLPVWRVAGAAVVVSASNGVRRAAAAATQVESEIPGTRSQVSAFLKAIRSYQWMKNLLVFVPIVTAHATGELDAWTHAGLLFFGFCLVASAIYLINDITDIEADRQHPRKSKRPFASGDLPIITGLALAPVMFAAGLVLGWFSGAVWVLLIYTAISLAYTVKLKEMPLIDVFALASLYTVRLFGGGEAAGHRVSLWLLGFSSFLFLSLAFVKRVAELRRLGEQDAKRTTRREYYVEDLRILETMGCAASFVSAMVLALYVQSDAVSRVYKHPEALWAIVPLMLFWQCRLWLSTARGYMLDDPIVYAGRDWVSWAVGASLLAILLLARAGI
ncbi:MAG TPA: UbiA family prenyltransferase [Candidatus Cybelea sp.]|nr:UbiA family prenyltransferase [Candidatus Cybelea sp.]